MTNFQEYQKLEYERVAEAHFKTIDAISSFFRYYLIVMSLPATAVAFFLSRQEDDTQVVLLKLSPQVEATLGGALIVVAAVGLCLMLYVMNLRMDGILYARAVNAIRKYFYDDSCIDLTTKQQLRVLPQTRYQPPYCEPRYFLPVVCTFLFLNIAYFFAGFSLWSHSWIEEYLPSWYSIAAIVLFTVLHFLFYLSYARYREHGYLETNAIGIDIDGVLNKHREKFCEILKQKTKIDIKPDQIQRMPVRDNKNLGISELDEITVFHDPTYWINMDVMEGAGKYLGKLRNELNLEIRIFSYRPWPVPNKSSVNKSNFDPDAWKHGFRQFRKETTMWPIWKTFTNPEGGLVSLRVFIASLPRLVKEWFLAGSRNVFVLLPWVHKIDRITHVWLYKHRLEYDRLIIEKGHANLASPNARFVNRFNMARRYNLRFFIEDDLEKATKMAHICDVVFLVDHPYNQQAYGLPANIRRVTTWDEIYNEVRKHS